MGNILKLFTAFDGRIGRQQFWIGIVLLFVATVAVDALLMISGFGQSVSGSAKIQVEGGASSQIHFVQSTLNPWAALAVAVIASAFLLAVLIKRRHDRNNNGLDAVAIVALSILLQFLPAAGIEVPIPITLVLSTLFLIGAVYLLIVTGFLRGTDDTNKYGSNPLARQSASPETS